MTGTPPPFRPRLRVTASPTDPYVTPGVAGPSLDTTNYQALAQLSPTLATMFTRMQEQGDKQAGQAAESNEARLYNLTAEQTKAVLLDKDDPQVKEYLKQAGVEYWHNPLVRESGLRALGSRVVDQSGIPSALKGQKGMETIARARMEAGPDFKAQQEAGFKAAMKLAEPILGELTEGIESDIARGAFTSRLEALAREANIAATTIQGKIHREDTADSIRQDIESYMDLGPKLDPIDTTMQDAILVDWDRKWTELKKQYPAYNIKKMVLDTLEAQLDLVAREFSDDSPQFETMVSMLNKLSESKGIMGTADNELNDLRVRAIAKITNRERRERDPDNQRKRMADAEQELSDLIEGYIGSSGRRTPAEVQAAIMAHPKTKDLLESGKLTYDDIRQLSMNWRQEEVEPKNQPVYHQLSMELREGNSSNYVQLMRGKHPDKDKLQAQYDALPDQMKASLSSLWDSKVQSKWGRDKKHEQVLIANAIVDLRVDARVGGAARHNAKVDALAVTLQDVADRAIEDGKTPEEVTKAWRAVLDKERPNREEETKSVRDAESYTTIANSDEFKLAISDATKLLQQSYREKTAEIEQMSVEDRSMVPTIESHQHILATASNKVMSSMPQLREQAMKTLTDLGVEPTGPMLTREMNRLASQLLKKEVSEAQRKFDRSLSNSVAIAMAPSIQAYHDEDRKPLLPSVSQAPAAGQHYLTHENMQKSLEAIREYRFGDYPDREDSGLRGWTRYLMGTYNDRYWGERAIKSMSWKARYDVKQGSRTKPVLEALHLSIYGVGLSPKNVQEGKLHGVGLDKIVDKDWRNNLSPRHIMYFVSEKELSAFMKKAEEGKEEAKMFMNIGYDLSKAEDRKKIIDYQTDLIQAQARTPNSWTNIQQTRKDFLK